MKQIKLGRLIAAACFAVTTLVSAQQPQLSVHQIDNETVTPLSMAQSLLGANSGIEIVNVTYTGAPRASGTFAGGQSIIGIDSGVLLTSGNVTNVVGPNNAPGASANNDRAGDTDLTELAGVDTHDASVLTITFIPTGTLVQFRYVFGSEEYNEFVGEFNDVFGFFVNGVNRAIVPSSNQVVSINNVNCGLSLVASDPPPGFGPNCALFVNNVPPARNTQLDGFTKVLTLVSPVNPNVPNTLKIAIADATDFVLDSAVFIAAGTFSVCDGPGQPPCVDFRVDSVNPATGNPGDTIVVTINGNGFEPGYTFFYFGPEVVATSSLISSPTQAQVTLQILSNATPGPQNVVGNLLPIPPLAPNGATDILENGFTIGASLPPGQLQLQPSTLAFGTQTVGFTSAPLAVTVTNVGQSAVTLTSITPPVSPFSLATGSSCAAGTVLNANVSCTINVTFGPSAVGQQTDTLTVLSNASNGSASVSLSGNGIKHESILVGP